MLILHGDPWHLDTFCTGSICKVCYEGSTVVSSSNGIDPEGTCCSFLQSRMTLGKVGLSSHWNHWSWQLCLQGSFCLWIGCLEQHMSLLGTMSKRVEKWLRVEQSDLECNRVPECKVPEWTADSSGSYWKFSWMCSLVLEVTGKTGRNLHQKKKN